jgi:hypothetical protein
MESQAPIRCGGCWRDAASPGETPLRRAREHEAALVQPWLGASAGSPEDPKIKALVQREEAAIYFGDAAPIRADHPARRPWGTNAAQRRSSKRPAPATP